MVDEGIVILNRAVISDLEADPFLNLLFGSLSIARLNRKGHAISHITHLSRILRRSARTASTTSQPTMNPLASSAIMPNADSMA